MIRESWRGCVFAGSHCSFGVRRLSNFRDGLVVEVSDRPIADFCWFETDFFILINRYRGRHLLPISEFIEFVLIDLSAKHRAVICAQDSLSDVAFVVVPVMRFAWRLVAVHIVDDIVNSLSLDVISGDSPNHTRPFLQSPILYYKLS